LSYITSDILALSFDGLTSPTIKLRLPLELQGTHPLGWGVAWYPNDNQAAVVTKDPVARGTEVMMDAMTDWNNYRSSIFFCKVKGAAKGYSHHETQPFTRSFAGQDWIFMHNGDLDKVKLGILHADKSRFLEPIGITDSELAFCYLLGKLQETAARKLSDVPNAQMLGWFEELDALGSADMCISDGITIACYYGTKSARNLYYTKLQPPNNNLVFSTDSTFLHVNDPRDYYRSSIIVTSSNFDAGVWTEMQPGQLLIIRQGAIIWDSIKDVNAKPKLKNGEGTIKKPNTSAVNIRSITKAPDGSVLSYRVYDITHSTEYTYDNPVQHSTHTFRLQPVEDPVQEVVHTTFTISAEGEETHYEDEFGNQCIHYSVHKPYNKLSITTQSRVKIFASPIDDHSLSQRQSSIPLVWMPWARQMMTPYLLPEELPESQLRALTEYAMSFVKRNGYNLIDTLRDMNLSIYRDYKYVQGITSNNTTPFEIYTSRQGVCQDFANLFICLARLLSIPARYRMGYIYTGVHYENKIQSDASHAWVEIYIPYVGWRGFDPTNGCQVAQDHVRVACGRNYRDSTPTSGTIYKGGGNERLTVEVKIQEVP